MHRANHLLISRGSGDTEHFGVQLHNGLRIVALAHAASDDDPAIFADGLADSVQRFLFCAVDESAGIDHHDICSLVSGNDIVPIHLQLGENTFGVNQCFGAT